ncbi:MAG: ABC transporter permease [Treponema sp.]|jgi:peptide/nickel transport system permease protein|nr:ABC transporter permease [Treponema sp.]
MTRRVGAGLALALAGLSAAGCFFLPYPYNETDSARRLLPPCAAHPLGTDHLGRDILSRVMAGGRATLLVALVTVAGSAAAGALLGLGAGLAGGLADEVIMRAMDCIAAFPGVLAALLVVSLAGNSLPCLTAALCVLFTPGFTRIFRSGMLQYRGADFVSAARVQGAGPLRIMFRHILPNLSPQVLAASVLGLSNAILAESAMSYLGLGVQPPVPSWGRMLAESQGYLLAAPWCALAPGACIVLAVLSFHLMGVGGE